jgi:hypothetical protein
MKRSTILLTVLFLLLGAGAWYALRNKPGSGRNSEKWDMKFAVEDPERIQRIFIADRQGHTVDLVREKDRWMYNGKFPARPTAVQTLLQTMKQMRVWYVPTNSATPNILKSLATQGIKVELYEADGKPFKTFYVGGVTNDERGTYVMMEGSEQPYVAHIPSFAGGLRVRFLLAEDDWRDRAVFREKPDEISAVTVEYPQQKSESFRLERQGSSDFTVRPFYTTTTPLQQPLRKGVAEAYLMQFENLTAEAFETENVFRDSIRALVPFAIVTIKKEGGEEKKATFWPAEVQRSGASGREDIFRFFTDVDSLDFLLTQVRVFGPVFRGYSYFFEEKPDDPKQ